MRTGIVGGTFDPVHFGHIVTAEELAEKFQLDQIIFIPTHINPHKKIKRCADTVYRLEMLHLATKSNNNFTVSDIEINRKGISYSIDTVKEIKKNLTEDTELFFITGMDVFKDLSSWKSPDELLKTCNFIVNTRPDYQVDNFMEALSNNITKKFPEVSFEDKGFDSTFDAWKISIQNSEFFIYTTKTTPLRISSTMIRQKIAIGETIKGLLPEKVEHYIFDKGLYQYVTHS